MTKNAVANFKVAFETSLASSTGTASMVSSFLFEMEVDHQGGFGNSLHRSIISEDRSLVASISPEHCLRILRLRDDGGIAEVVNTPLPKSLHQLLARPSSFKWAPTVGEVSPESESDGNDAVMPLLLLSDGFRLVVINPNRTVAEFKESVARNGTSTGFVVADYQLGDQFGKLSYANFFLGNDHVLVLFEMGANASILSLTKPQREDVPNIKFNSDRAVAVSPNGRSLAMLLRSKGQDQIMVLGLEGGNAEVQVTFNTYTNDAQNLMWSPDGDPVIVVHESPAYGVKMLFFSALGHPLKQLEVSEFHDESTISGTGVTNLKWAAVEGGTILAVADGEKRLLLRRQHNRTMSTQRLALLIHENIIDGSKSIVWQQTEDVEYPFSLQKGAFDAVVDHTAGGNTSILEFNRDRDFIATVVADNPKAVWIWQPNHTEPHTIILFQEPIQQLLWHPKRPDVLLVMTNQKAPVVYVWYSEAKSPSACAIHLANLESTRYQGCWLRQNLRGRHPFLLSTTKAFELGMLEEYSGSVAFKSLSHDGLGSSRMDEDEDTAEEISTPSKPDRKGASRGNLKVMQGLLPHQLQSADASKW